MAISAGAFFVQRRVVCLGLFVAAFIVSNEPAQASDADRVLVVFNANWVDDNDGNGTQDSLQVAAYYAARRGVPLANILGLNCSTRTNGSYQAHGQFYSETVVPIKKKLAALGTTEIDVILLCYGVPITTPSVRGGNVCLDNALIGINDITATNNIGPRNNPYFETTPSFDRDKAHFDHATYKINGQEMYLTGRIDGLASQAPFSSMRLIDQALYGERYIHENEGHYKGTAYVDSRQGQCTDEDSAAKGALTTGSIDSTAHMDKNIAYTEHFFRGRGFPTKFEVSEYEIGEVGATYSDQTSAETAPDAIFYAGWYNYNQYRDVWSWLPGSVACDLNSASCVSIRAENKTSFGAAALQRGATAVSGVIGEPFITGHQRPNVLIYYIMQGFGFAEASILSTPTVGWMPINIGDPLYTPMKPKSAVIDTQSPSLAVRFPRVSANFDSGTRVVYVAVSQAALPEVAKIELEYGLTKAYGQTIDSGQGFWSGRAMEITGLQGGSTYHYRITLTDPVGNVTVTDDYTFTTRRVRNTAPTSGNHTVLLQHDRASIIKLPGDDAEGNALIYTVVSGPAFGTLSDGTGATRTYTPAAGYHGHDRFTFKIDDGALESGLATVSIDVQPTEAVTLVLQQGLDGYAGAKDTLIYERQANRNYGGWTSLETYHNGLKRILLEFDLSAIPADATVVSADLQLYCHQYGFPVEGQAINLYRMTRSWGEGTSTERSFVQDGCTYQEYDHSEEDGSAGGDWTTPGGDYDPAVRAQQSTDNVLQNRWLDWDLRDLTQDWVSGEATNHGVLIRTHTGSVTIRYLSNEYTGDTAKRPKLTIRYFPSSDERDQN